LVLLQEDVNTSCCVGVHNTFQIQNSENKRV